MSIEKGYVGEGGTLTSFCVIDDLRLWVLRSSPEKIYIDLIGWRMGEPRKFCAKNDLWERTSRL